MNRGQSSLVFAIITFTIKASLSPVINLTIAYGNGIICILYSRKYGQVEDDYAIATIITSKHYCILLAIVICFTIPYIRYLASTDSSIYYSLRNGRIKVDSQIDLSAIATIYIRYNCGVCTIGWVSSTLPCIWQLASTDSHSCINYLQSRSSHIECVIRCLYITAGILYGKSHGVGSSATCDISSGPLYFNHISQRLSILCQVERLDSLSRSCHIWGGTRSQDWSCTSDGI